MDAVRYRRLRDLVHAASDLAAEERGAWLAARCPDDPALVEEALSFLGTSERPTQAGLIVGRGGSAPLALAPGTTIGRWRIEGEIGRGGMGVVVAARDPASGNEAAVKVIRPELLATPGARTRFLREARLGLAIAHANVVRTL